VAAVIKFISEVWEAIREKRQVNCRNLTIMFVL